jgi:hypothetical protein
MPILGVIASSTRQGQAADTGAMFPLQVITVGAAGASSVSFTNIPATYSHLQVRITALGDTATGYDVTMRFNSDTASNYNWHRLYGNGSSALAQGSASVTSMYVAADAARTTYPFVSVIDILDYADTNKYTTIRNLNGFDQNGGGAVTLWSGLWRNTAAVNSIAITVAANNLAQYSQFALYAVKGA